MKRPTVLFICPHGAAKSVMASAYFQQVAKEQFPTAAVYGPTARSELRLITCGGRFDRTAHSYTDNVVVEAVAV